MFISGEKSNHVLRFGAEYLISQTFEENLFIEENF
jgi:hypothetical protein